MVKLAEAAENIGRTVLYRPLEGATERGVIASVTEAGWVFVRYGTDTHAKATYPSQLEFDDPKVGA